MRITNLLVILYIIIFGVISFNFKGAEPKVTKEKKAFVIIYKPGAKWVKGNSVFEQNLLEHGNYMAELLKKGILKYGGPFTDDAGGMIIISVDSEKEAKAIIENDPGIKLEVFSAELHPWMIAFKESKKE
jgi:uncharacterized protein YciI